MISRLFNSKEESPLQLCPSLLLFLQNHNPFLLRRVVSTFCFVLAVAYRHSISHPCLSILLSSITHPSLSLDLLQRAFLHHIDSTYPILDSTRLPAEWQIFFRVSSFPSLWQSVINSSSSLTSHKALMELLQEHPHDSFSLLILYNLILQGDAASSSFSSLIGLFLQCLPQAPLPPASFCSLVFPHTLPYASIEGIKATLLQRLFYIALQKAATPSLLRDILFHKCMRPEGVFSEAILACLKLILSDVSEDGFTYIKECKNCRNTVVQCIVE